MSPLHRERHLLSSAAPTGLQPGANCPYVLRLTTMSVEVIEEEELASIAIQLGQF